MHQPRKFFIAHFLCVLVLGLSAEASRPGAWRVEYLPGSARLALPSIRYVVLPDDCGEPLRAAVDDLCNVFERRYGVELQLLSDSVRRPKAAIYLGASAARALSIMSSGCGARARGSLWAATVSAVC